MSTQTVFATIPVAEVPNYAFAKRPTADRPVILVVDDEHIIADTLSTILNQSGFVAMTAYGAAAALEIASVVPPQLLITDVMMPGMNGIDLGHAMKSMVADCEVILFSGHASMMEYPGSARTAGHNFLVLTKPVHPAEMLARISERLHTPRRGLHLVVA